MFVSVYRDNWISWCQVIGTTTVPGWDVKPDRNTPSGQRNRDKIKINFPKLISHKKTRY